MGARRRAGGRGIAFGIAALAAVMLWAHPGSAQPLGCVNVTSCVDNNVMPAGAPCGSGDDGKCCVLHDPCASCPAGTAAHCFQGQCIGELSACPVGHSCTQGADCASGNCVDGACAAPAPAMSAGLQLLVALGLLLSGLWAVGRGARRRA